MVKYSLFSNSNDAATRCCSSVKMPFVGFGTFLRTEHADSMVPPFSVTVTSSPAVYPEASEVVIASKALLGLPASKSINVSSNHGRGSGVHMPFSITRQLIRTLIRLIVVIFNSNTVPSEKMIQPHICCPMERSLLAVVVDRVDEQIARNTKVRGGFLHQHSHITTCGIEVFVLHLVGRQNRCIVQIDSRRAPTLVIERRISLGAWAILTPSVFRNLGNTRCRCNSILIPYNTTPSFPGQMIPVTRCVDWMSTAMTMQTKGGAKQIN